MEWKPFADVTLKLRGCSPDSIWKFDIPNACLDYPDPIEHWGDGILEGGTDDPYDTPGEGGARFLVDGPYESHQWQVVANQNNVLTLTVDANIVPNDPAFHTKIPTNLDRLYLACGWQHRITLSFQLKLVILARAGGSWQAVIPCE